MSLLPAEAPPVRELKRGEAAGCGVHSAGATVPGRPGERRSCPRGKVPLFAGLDNCRFRRQVVPGDTLRLEVTTLRTGNKLQKMHGVVTVDGLVTAEADILSIITDRS